MAAPAFAMKADKLMCLIGDEDTVTGFLLAGIGEVDASKNSNFLVVTPSNPCARARCLRFSCNWVCRVMLTSNLACRVQKPRRIRSRRPSRHIQHAMMLLLS